MGDLASWATLAPFLADRISAKKDEGIIETIESGSDEKLLVMCPLKPVVACFCFCFALPACVLSRKMSLHAPDSQGGLGHAGSGTGFAFGGLGCGH